MKTNKTFAQYLKQPEFRPVFYLTPLVIVSIIVDIIYLPDAWTWIGIAIMALILAILIGVSWRLSRANTKVKSEKLEMQTIISHLPIGVLAYDGDFNVLIFNPAAQQIFEISEKDILSQKLSANMATDSKLGVLTQVVFSSLAPTVIKRSDPGVYPQIVDISFENPHLELRVITDRIMNDNGNQMGFVKLITNRTREAELLKSKTEFLTVAAHQLRTPLTAVNWSFEALEGSSLNEEQKQLADTGFMAAKKMLKTVNDLLDASKMEEGKFGFQFQEVKVVPFLEEFLGQMNEVANQYGVKLYFQRPLEQNLSIYADPQKLSMVLSNLVDNAIKYNVENGEVTVSAEKQDDQFVKFSVKDTGIGIPAQQIDKMFTKFFRADNVVKYAPDGTGLGLNIAKNIIVRNGGKIWVESEINRGTTFYFTLPINEELIPKKELIEFE